MWRPTFVWSQRAQPPEPKPRMFQYMHRSAPPSPVIPVIPTVPVTPGNPAISAMPSIPPSPALPQATGPDLA